MKAVDQLNKIMGTIYEGQNADALKEMDLYELERLIEEDRNDHEIEILELEDRVDTIKMWIQDMPEEPDHETPSTLEAFFYEWEGLVEAIGKL